jgi:hypothetical protein
MSHYQKTIAARERAKNIREVRESILARVSRHEDVSDIRRALQSTSASEFVSAEVL